VPELAQPRFIDHGALTIAGFVRRYTPDTLSQLGLQWGELQLQMSLMVGQVGADAFGVWYGVLSGGREFGYLAGVRVGEFSPVHPSFQTANIVPLHYAVFTHQGPQSDLRRTVDAIISQWLPKSGREIHRNDPNQPDFLERYSEEFNKTGQGPIEIWLPVKKK
jgi:AraC family transcriptional regulator